VKFDWVFLKGLFEFALPVSLRAYPTFTFPLLMRLAVCLLSDMYSWLMPALSFADDGVWVNELILSALFRLESLMFTVAVGRGNATVLPLYASAGAYW